MIIGLTGNIGSGKSLVAEYFKTKFNAEEYILSTPIKEIAIIIGFSRKNVYGTQEDKEKIDPILGISVREFLQQFGTTIGRNMFSKIFPNMNLGYYKNIWLQMFINYYEKFPKNKLIVVSDVRFLDEFDYIKKKQGTIIKINRNINKCCHQSETELEYISPDYTVYNDGSQNDLFNKIDYIFSYINMSRLS